MIRLAIRAPSADAELVLAELLALTPSGVEQVDGEGWVEYAVYGTPGELPSLPEGEAEVAGVRVRVSGEPVAEDWAERWKRFHRPVLIADRLYVRPPWEQPAVRPGVQEIVIDPGQAFGTGTHPTTATCLELLCGLRGRGSFADLGSGSGVLAIAAARLGHEPVKAYDADVLAVDATRANARANGVELDAVERFDLRHGPAPEAETVAANLMRPLLLSLAKRLEPPRELLLSGLLDHEADEVAAAFTPLVERERLTEKGWAALLLSA
ncbi:MAG: 50S ribosomal protein L11 methyltransferase [Thermoleophilaceae bacterium]|nr:50S ribosomal protein L11 methyltransferase [Thermoleophilaceae bacterium]